MDKKFKNHPKRQSHWTKPEHYQVKEGSETEDETPADPATKEATVEDLLAEEQTADPEPEERDPGLSFKRHWDYARNSWIFENQSDPTDRRFQTPEDYEPASDSEQEPSEEDKRQELTNRGLFYEEPEPPATTTMAHINITNAELQTLMQNAMNAALAMHQAAQPALQPRVSRNEARAPPDFTGEFKKYPDFRRLLKLYADHYSNDSTKIRNALSFYISDDAGRWARSWIEVNEANLATHTITWDQFLADSNCVFQDPNREQKAQLNIFEMKMHTSETVAAFMLRFDEAQNQSKTTHREHDMIHITMLSKALPYQVYKKAMEFINNDKMTRKMRNTAQSLATPPTMTVAAAKLANDTVDAERPTYKQFKKLVEEIDKLERPEIAFGTWIPRNRTYNGGSYQSPRTATAAPTATTTHSTDVAMEIDALRRKGRGNPIKCYNCQKFGHIGRNCPEPDRCKNCPGRPQRARALATKYNLNQMSFEEVRAYVMTKEKEKDNE